MRDAVLVEVGRAADEAELAVEPLEMSLGVKLDGRGTEPRAALGDRTLLFTTTNGTPALDATHGARACFFASFVNIGATVSALRAELAEKPGDVLVLCSGHERRMTLEDVVCAGRIVRLLSASEAPDAFTSDDGALAAERMEAPYRDALVHLSSDATHARALRNAGFGADVDYCLTVDSVPVAVAYMHHRLELH